ncbi:hypothetical protein MK280_11520 [Myxococcota bacterium]|nr:hypothetical protein [Myxococcota bacterium]
MTEDRAGWIRARNQPRWLRWGFAAVLAWTFFIPGSVAFAGGFLSPGSSASERRPTWAAPAKRLEVSGLSEDEALLARLENARMRLLEAEQNAVTANFNLTRARTRRYPRGEGLRELQERQATWEREQREAEVDFLRLLDEARRQGVGSGRLLPFEEIADEIESGRRRS